MVGRHIKFTQTDKTPEVSASRDRKQCNRNNFVWYIGQEMRQKSIKTKKNKQ